MFESPSHDPLGRSNAEIGFEVSLAILMGLSAMLGNLLVAFVINKDSRLHNVTNMLINNLALTDIAMATICMPFWIASLYTGSWNFSQKLCQVSGSVLAILAYTSIITMGLIAINRYIQVVKPNLYIKVFPSKRAARIYCVLVWLVSILIAIPFLGGWVEISYHPKLSICNIESSVYTTLIAGMFTTVFIITIFYCYFKIYKAVRESAETLNAHADENRVHPDSNDSRSSNSTEIVVLKSCFTVVCLFVITWSPISFIAITWSVEFDIGPKISTASVYLMFSSSLVNPFVYGIMNPRFKLAFKRAFTFSCHGNGNRDHVGEVQIEG